jgi:protein-S-isoprenylcysteine O-methyltransferase Ste14
MFIRALFAFLVLPGVVAGLLPVLIARGDTHRHDGSAIGFGVLALGVVLLLWCVRDFYVSGKGTLAPCDPPKRLVVVGLYRFVRNPMYVAVLTVVLDWSLVFGSTWLAIYIVALTMAFHLRVLQYEEPRLRHNLPRNGPPISQPCQDGCPAWELNDETRT